MEKVEAEGVLYEKMIQGGGSSELHREILKEGDLPLLKGIAAVGFDTNVLKKLRHNAVQAETMLLTLQDNEVSVIAPAQSVIEYWNNHKVFSAEEWSFLGNDFGRLVAKLEARELDGPKADLISEIRARVETLTVDVESERSPEYLQKSRDLMEALLKVATKPMVSRVRFVEIARVRQLSKTPPGFADERLKAAALGDYFVWCDFLLGALMLDTPGDKPFVWVTDESKPDWKTGSVGHPALLEEFFDIVGNELLIVSNSQFLQILAASKD